jgi:hypothetical protein
MECEEILVRLWEYLDQELGREEAELVVEHLHTCSGCYPVYCCDRAFLALVARQRTSARAPASLVRWAQQRFPADI